MKSYLNYIVILFSVLLLSNAHAQENLDALLVTAAKNNPGLKAKYNKYLADLQKVPQVGSLPEPDVSFGIFIQQMELMNGKQRAQIQAMQMFPWFGVLKAAKDEASTMALSSFELFRADKEDLFYKIRANYFQLFLVKKQLEVYDTTYVLLKSIEQLLLTKTGTANISSSIPANSNTQLQSANPTQGSNSMAMNAGGNKNASTPSMTPMASQGMSGGSSAFSDLLRLQVEIKELENNMASLNNRMQMLTIQINSLLNRNADVALSIPDSLSIPNFDYQSITLFDSIKANNPMMNMNRADVLAYQQRQLMNKKMSYPMIGLGFNYMLINKSEMNTSPMNGADMVMPMVTVKVPLYRKKYNAAIKEAELLESASTEQIANVEKMLFMEFSEYQFALKDSERKRILYNDIVSLTERSFELLLVQYTSSGADFDAIIRLHRQLLDYKINLHQAQVDKLTAIAGLQKLTSKN